MPCPRVRSARRERLRPPCSRTRRCAPGARGCSTRLARESTGSSTRIARAILLDSPPSIDLGEITDKGSINQRAVLKHRAALVEEIYAEPRVAADDRRERERGRQ